MRLAKTFGALANPTRLAVLERLAEPRYAPDLEAALGLSRQALKRHLDVLVATALVQARRTKRGTFHAIEYVADADALAALREDVRRIVAADYHQ